MLALVTAGAGLALLLNRDSGPAPAVRSTPAYGAAVSSPVTVGGRITGVDERLAVQVRSRQGGLLGRSAGMPAGGERTPWSAQVAYSAPAGTVLTLAVSTSGHVAAVERFAITAAPATDSAGLADGRHAGADCAVECFWVTVSDGQVTRLAEQYLP